MRDLQTVFTMHNQLQNWSCSASAHEFIAKLHGAIELDAHPLQNLDAAGRAGFQFEEFLNSLGFTGRDDHLTPTQCIHTFEQECAGGRFPLVSVLSDLGTNHSYWHIVVAAPSCEGIGLADPAKRSFTTLGTTETLTFLNRLSHAIPNRPKINVLTYKTQ
jgi:hypothetical protein